MSKEKHSIWIMLDSRTLGGIESHVMQLAKGLHRYGEDVVVVFLNDYGEHPIHSTLHKHGISTIVLDGRLRSLWKKVRCFRPSVIHTHGYKAGILGRLVTTLCKIPVISTYHMGESPSGKIALYDWLDRYTARFAAKVFAVSPQIAQRLPIKATVTDNFVDISNIEISNGDQIAFVGRLSKEKGPDKFLTLAKQFPQSLFHIYGDGPQAVELIDLASDNVYFHGLQDDMSLIWPKIEILIMPSRHEGLPMAALEAMAHGIPVIASNVGALDDLIDSDKNGWLVVPEDSHELTFRLQQWFDMNEQQRQAFKLAATKKIQQRFSADKVIPTLILDYKQIAVCDA